MSEAIEGARIDVWLWRARLFKTRALAAHVIRAGRARLSGASGLRRLTKPSALVRPGDELTLPVNRKIVRLTVLELGVRRGPATEARALYALIEDGADAPVRKEAEA